MPHPFASQHEQYKVDENASNQRPSQNYIKSRCFKSTVLMIEISLCCYKVMITGQVTSTNDRDHVSITIREVSHPAHHGQDIPWPTLILKQEESRLMRLLIYVDELQCILLNNV